MGPGQRAFGVETGRRLLVTADGFPEYKVGGVTYDWAAASMPVAGAGGVTLDDGTFVPEGRHYMRYGTVISENTTYEVQTVTTTGGPAGGTFTLTVTVDGVARTTGPIDFDATAAEVRAALEALDTVGPEGLRSVTGGPLPTGVVVTFDIPGNLAAMTHTDALTGGTSPAVAVATGTQGTTGAGHFAPATNATTLVRDRTFILNETVTEDDEMSDHAGGPFHGGRVFEDRLLVGTATTPALADLLAACPRLILVRE